MREPYLVKGIYLHSIGVSVGVGEPSWLGLLDIAVPSSSELPESYHVSVELSSLIKLLFAFPSHLFLTCRKDSSGHHCCQLIGDPLLKDIDQDVVGFDTNLCLGQSECHGAVDNEKGVVLTYR